MAEAKKKAAKKTATVSKEAVAVPAEVKPQQRIISDFYSVKNTSDRVLNTCKGSINPGETGIASAAECRQYIHYLEKVDG